MSRFRDQVLRASIALLVVLTIAWPAIAQAAPSPVLRKGTPVWLGYAVMFVLTLAVIVVSLMPSKRSHQD